MRLVSLYGRHPSPLLVQRCQAPKPSVIILTRAANRMIMLIINFIIILTRAANRMIMLIINFIIILTRAANRMIMLVLFPSRAKKFSEIAKMVE